MGVVRCVHLRSPCLARRVLLTSRRRGCGGSLHDGLQPTYRVHSFPTPAPHWLQRLDGLMQNLVLPFHRVTSRDVC
jgi:hypothetical protein